LRRREEKEISLAKIAKIAKEGEIKNFPGVLARDSLHLYDTTAFK
jgi:hypothetical protein